MFYKLPITIPSSINRTLQYRPKSLLHCKPVLFTHFEVDDFSNDTIDNREVVFINRKKKGTILT